MPELTLPTAYAFLTEYEVRPNQFPRFREAASRVASAYSRSAGISWAAYATFVGPTSSLFVLVPLDNLSQLDEIPPMNKVLADEHGEGAVKRYQVRGDRLVVDAHEANGKAGGLFAGETGLIEADDALPAFSCP